MTVTALWVATSATAANIDLGLYDASGVRLVSTGSVGKGTTTIEKVVDVTDTTIGPGLYYFAVAADNNTGTFTGAAPAAPLATAVGVLAEASAFTLPATATFALDHTLALYVAGGLMTTTLVA